MKSLGERFATVRRRRLPRPGRDVLGRRRASLLHGLRAAKHHGSEQGRVACGATAARWREPNHLRLRPFRQDTPRHRGRTRSGGATCNAMWRVTVYYPKLCCTWPADRSGRTPAAQLSPRKARNPHKPDLPRDAAPSVLLYGIDLGGPQRIRIGARSSKSKRFARQATPGVNPSLRPLGVCEAIRSKRWPIIPATARRLRSWRWRR